MRFKHIINVIDSHTEGEPTRIATSGLPFLPGNTMAERRDYFKAEFDYLRKAILWEPRGHRDMFGAILTSPTDSRAQIGAFFIDSEGYLDMCGHGSIGIATVCFDMGILPPKRPENGWFLDTPIGLVSFRPELEADRIKTITVQNVPSFLFESDLSLSIPEIGEVKADVAFGGNFFILVDTAKLGISVDNKQIKNLIDMGMVICEAANKKIKVYHPQFSNKKSIELVEFYENLKNREADAKNVVIFGKGQFDRSPCGTGTCAKMAALHAKGLLELNVDYIQQSILGTFFTGKLVSETKVGKFSAVIPEITGRAWITGFNQLVVDPKDPFAEGFFLS
ncbi:MAG TPA: proline racemase family protein [Desulfatiglandales bacterium]|nr:proline racemase family protein [Desulfatiglandales bacterium]